MEAITAELLPSNERVRGTKGYRYYDPETKERILREYHASGLTQKASAQKSGVKLCTLVSWIQGLRTRRKSEAAGPVVFQEVKLPAVTRRSALEVTMPDGTKITVGDAREIADLVRELGRR